MLSPGLSQPIIYFKRFRMEIDLDGPLPAPRLPAGFRWVP